MTMAVRMERSVGTALRMGPLAVCVRQATSRTNSATVCVRACFMCVCFIDHDFDQMESDHIIVKICG